MRRFLRALVQRKRVRVIRDGIFPTSAFTNLSLAFIANTRMTSLIVLAEGLGHHYFSITNDAHNLISVKSFYIYFHIQQSP